MLYKCIIQRLFRLQLESLDGSQSGRGTRKHTLYSQREKKGNKINFLLLHLLSISYTTTSSLFDSLSEVDREYPARIS
jgi:hypothetical protein